jgi:hypothetical protein
LEDFRVHAPRQSDIAIDFGVQLVKLDPIVLHARSELRDTLVKSSAGDRLTGTEGPEPEADAIPT